MAAAQERVEAAPLPFTALLVSTHTCKLSSSVKIVQSFKASHIKTVGVRRNGFGSGGKQVNITVNAFPVQVPEGYIYHYDGQCVRFLPFWLSF